MASTGCHAGYVCDYEIFLHQLGAAVDQRVRVTNDSHFDGYPSIHIGKLWQPGQTWLTLVPGRVTFSGEQPAPRRIKLRNSGSGTLERASTSVVYTKADGWLSVQHLGAGNSQELELAVKTDRLGPGEHRATLQVAVGNAASSPVICPVTFVVPGCPDAGTCILDLPVYAADEGCQLGVGQPAIAFLAPLRGGAPVLAPLLGRSGMRRRRAGWSNAILSLTLLSLPLLLLWWRRSGAMGAEHDQRTEDQHQGE